MRAAALFFLSLLSLLSAFADESRSQKVDELFAAYNQPYSPGCSIGVVQDGKFVYRKSYGQASLELATPLNDVSVFYLASVSKQFTAAAVVLAAEQGHLSLDDDVRKYVPELPDYGHVITLRQMLHHTSGLRDFLSLVYLSGRDIADLSSPHDVLALIARQKGLNNVPGAEFVYSNSNYFLAGVALQRATSKSLADFAAQNIFQPLGMSHTRYYDNNSVVVPNRVAAYDQAEGGGGFTVDWSTKFDIVGSGGMLSTVGDLLLWDNNFYLNHLGKGGLPPELQTPGKLSGGKRINYGLGLWLGKYRGLATVEHSGGTFGYRTELLRFPAQRFSVIELCNVQNADVENLARKIATLYLGDQLQPEAALSSAGRFGDPAPYAGTYVDSQTHVVYTFTAQDGKLSAWGSVLRRFGPNQFYDLVGNPITFEERNGLMTARLDLEGETYFAGARVQQMHLNVGELSTFAGQYHSEELDADYILSVEGDRLLLRVRDQAPITLQAIGPEEFTAGDFGTVTFRPGAKRRIVALTLFSQDARGIDFVKAR